jgi:hypothetical protein
MLFITETLTKELLKLYKLLFRLNKSVLTVKNAQQIGLFRENELVRTQTDYEES